MGVRPTKRKAPNPTGKGGFKKGSSGNPGGKGRMDIRFRDLAREHTDDAIAVLAEIMMNKNEKAQVRAYCANSLIDRGYGRPAQSVSITGKDGEPLKGLNVAFVEQVNVIKDKEGQTKVIDVKKVEDPK